MALASSPYVSREAWCDALARLFDADRACADSHPTPEQADKECADATAALYVPDVTELVLDGNTMDYEAIMTAIRGIRGTIAQGSTIAIHVTAYDGPGTPPQAEDTYRGVMRMRIMANVPAEAGDGSSSQPKTRQLVMHDVEIEMCGKLDLAKGRATHVTATSRGVKDEDDDDD